ncbi:MAG: 5-formyltetrahydrofolate cyclo-ligase [Rhizobiales bacterium 65-9]|nr:5-formyltetrahydrofolate cyclo-ligase [Hyphomicrobiales bacterium]OJY32913.1 MAG: 5-formyltetrahydrofolate cyclo-ligase [Rhizobiales bacterium 65-9]
MAKPSEIKARLRRAALGARDSLLIDDRLIWDEQIIERLLALPQVQATKGPVAGYWQMRSEVDIRPALAEMANRGLTICLPAVVEDELAFRKWKPWDPVIPGGFGTLVPPPDAEIVDPALAFVPLAAFDRRCARIGYGKGYYDRALLRLGAAGGLTAIGIAYSAQETAEIPLDPWDRRLDMVVTEKETMASDPTVG